jgi:type VI protein secretion system component Hcp
VKVAPALVIGLISTLAGLVVGYAGAGLKMATQTQTTTSVGTTIQTVFSTVTTTAAGNMAPQQHPSYFISLAGVSGEASVLNYTGLIQLKAWDWGPPRTACGPAGGPAGGSCNTMETSLNFNATTSKASVTLQMDASQGTPIPTGTLIGVATIGGQQTVVAKCDFTNLLVSSYSTDSHGTLPVDVVALVFQNVTIVV